MKEAVGSLTGEADLQNEGRIDRPTGEVKQKAARRPARWTR
jgi:uncharacterized protein YjbJ (UPF0337 family)